MYYNTRKVYVEIREDGSFSYNAYGSHLLKNPVKGIQINHLGFTTIEILEGKHKGKILRP